MHIKILKTSKKALLALFAFCSVFFAYTEQYQISETHYDIQGITREYPLKTKVEVDYHKIFENEEELLGYIKDLKQRLENTRAFEEINIDFSVLEATEEGIYPVKVFIKTKDAKHLLALPYPKFDSNSGFLFKLKAKDTNFLGSLEEMAGELNFQIESDKDPWEYTTGLAFSFETPFKAGPFKEVLTNDHSFSYTIGKNTPEWNFKVGLTSELPFEKYSIKFDFFQSFIRDLDYEVADINGKAKYYGDGTYFTEDARETIKENGNILYHITESLNVPDILRKGLRPKTGKRKYQGGYRYFPERLYLIGNNPNIVENIDSVIIDKQFEKRGIQYSILKIDLGEHNVSLWYDDAAVGKYNVYTIEAIPPSLISITTLDEIQKSIRNERQ